MISSSSSRMTAGAVFMASELHFRSNFVLKCLTKLAMCPGSMNLWRALKIRTTPSDSWALATENKKTLIQLDSCKNLGVNQRKIKAKAYTDLGKKIAHNSNSMLWIDKKLYSIKKAFKCSKDQSTRNAQSNAELFLNIGFKNFVKFSKRPTSISKNYDWDAAERQSKRSLYTISQRLYVEF